MTLVDLSTHASFRAPTPLIIQWDDMACEAACTAQLLYMYERLDLPFDAAAFDRRIGRQSGTGDLNCGTARLLFEEGFEVSSISPYDVERLATDRSYVRDGLIRDGDAPEEVDAYLVTTYPQIRQRALTWLSFVSQFSSQYSEIVRDSTWDDVVDLINEGYHVTCSLWRPDGFSHVILVTREVDPGQFEVFFPETGLKILNGLTDLAPILLPGVTAARLVVA
jgi:hypothetical protein